METEPNLFIAVAVLWTVPAVLVGLFAARRGLHFLAITLLGLVTSFVVALVVVLVLLQVSDRGLVIVRTGEPEPERDPGEDIRALQQLSGLHEDGVLDDNAYAQQVAQVLARPSRS